MKSRSNPARLHSLPSLPARRWRATRLLAVAAVSAACLMMEAQAARQALVVGNDNYVNVTKLKNARNDANAIARELERAGFKVTRALDVTRESMNDALDAFIGRLEKGDEVVFYFSGHGSQPPNSGPHLLPVDIRVTDARMIERDGLSLEKLLLDLNKRARFSLVIIDACRDDPFKPPGRSIAPGSQLANVEPPSGSVIMMAAAKGQQALDRLSDRDPVPNGLFTRELIKHMNTKGLSASEMLLRVRMGVLASAKSVNHTQTPSLIDESTTPFYFHPGAGGAAPAPAPDPAPAPPPPPAPVPTPVPSTGMIPPRPAPAPPAPPISANDAQRELDAWDQAQKTGTRSGYENFLRQFPNGRYASRAQAKVTEFGAAAPAPAPAPAPTPARPNDPRAEFDLWDRAQSSNKRTDYEAYLRAYPNGRYADRARAALPKAAN